MKMINRAAGAIIAISVLSVLGSTGVFECGSMTAVNWLLNCLAGVLAAVGGWVVHMTTEGSEDI